MHIASQYPKLEYSAREEKGQWIAECHVSKDVCDGQRRLMFALQFYDTEVEAVADAKEVVRKVCAAFGVGVA